MILPQNLVCSEEWENPTPRFFSLSPTGNRSFPPRTCTGDYLLKFDRIETRSAVRYRLLIRSPNSFSSLCST